MLNIAADIVNGLIELHKYGIIHCNIKPSNIIFFTQLSNRTVSKFSDYDVFTHNIVIGTDVQRNPVECLLRRDYTALGDIW